MRPRCTGSVHARTPGAPSTATRQFGQWPAQHISPRRRWYLKLRENVRCPAAYSAEPIVSPSSAVTRLAVERERDRLRSRSIRSPGCCGRRAHGMLTRARREARHPQHLVRAGVALGLEPRAAPGAVVPPLALHAGDVAAEVVVLVQLAERRGAARGRVVTSPPNAKSATSRTPQCGHVSTNDIRCAS